MTSASSSMRSARAAAVRTATAVRISGSASSLAAVALASAMRGPRPGKPSRRLRRHAESLRRLGARRRSPYARNDAPVDLAVGRTTIG
jgi:hypothetical protein